MPKFSLKRRHRRQKDLCLLQQSSVESLMNRESTARKVSDDDIQLSTCNEPAGESCRRRHSEGSVVSLGDTVKPFQRNEGLCFLDGFGRTVSKRALVIDSDSCCCLSPKEMDNPVSRGQNPSNEPISPWGQFVDMAVSVSSSDEEFESPHSVVPDSSNKRSRFLPFCPSPATPFSSHYQPYQRSAPKRQRLHRRGSTESVDMHGFVLRVPDDSTARPSQFLLVEAQNAFEELRF